MVREVARCPLGPAQFDGSIWKMVVFPWQLGEILEKWTFIAGNMTEIHGELSSKPCLMTPEGQRVLPISLTCCVPHVLFHRLSGSHMSLWCLEAFWYHIVIPSHIVSHVSYHAIFFADVHISLSQKRSLKVYTAARDQMLNPSDTAGHDNLECV